MDKNLDRVEIPVDSKQQGKLEELKETRNQD